MSATVLINTQDTDVNALTLSNWDGATTSNKVIVGFDNSGRGSFAMGMPASTNAFAFYSSIDGASNERLRITSTGNIGIGNGVTYTPESPLDVTVNHATEAMDITTASNNNYQGDTLGDITCSRRHSATKHGTFGYSCLLYTSPSPRD